MFNGWQFCLVHKVNKQFCIYLGSGFFLLQTDFCVKPWDCAGSFEYHESYVLSEKNDKVWTFTSKNGLKKVILWKDLSRCCKTGIHLSISKPLRGGISWNIPLTRIFVMQWYYFGSISYYTKPPVKLWAIRRWI